LLLRLGLVRFSRVSRFSRVKLARVSDRIRVSLVLVIVWRPLNYTRPKDGKFPTTVLTYHRKCDSYNNRAVNSAPFSDSSVQMQPPVVSAFDASL